MKTKILLLLAFLTINLAAVAEAYTVAVESNQVLGNSLLTFNLDQSGSLSPLVEVPTQGLGFSDPSLALGPYDSDQEILVSKARGILFAVNTGSNSISVFQIQDEGSLMPVAGSPFDSHGIGPVSVGLKNNILTVVNKHGDPAQAADGSLPNYSTFFVTNTGALEWTGHVFPVASGSSPSQALTTPWGNFVIGADFLGGLLRSFELSSDGQLKSRSELGLPENEFANSSVPRLPLGLAAHPTKNLVYVGFPTSNKIGVYETNHWGSLKFKNAIKDSGNVVCWLLTNREGTRLYASNTADPSVTVYDIATNPESPAEVQKIMLASLGGAYQIALSPDERQLAVLTQRFQASTPQGQGNEIHILEINQDGMAQMPVAPVQLSLPPDTRPQGIVIY